MRRNSFNRTSGETFSVDIMNAEFMLMASALATGAMAATDTGPAAMLLLMVTVSTHSVAGVLPVGVTDEETPSDPADSPKSAAVTLETPYVKVAVNVITLPLTVPSSAASVEE